MTSVPYFDHDHREGENIRFLATGYHFLQDLWRRPSQSVATLMRGELHGTRILSDGGEAKIRDAHTTGVIDKDVWLARCKYDIEMRVRAITYSLDVPMNYIVGVEVTEALSGVG